MLIDDVKKALRVSNTAMDTEVNDLIESAKLDLTISGVNVDKTVTVDGAEVMDPLIKRAITVYCKANFGYDNPDADRLMDSFEMLKTHLALSAEYSGFAVIFNVTTAGNPMDEVSVIFNGETKLTGSQGTAIFYARAGNNYDYVVSTNGYSQVEGNIDVSASTTINIPMVAG